MPGWYEVGRFAVYERHVGGAECAIPVRELYPDEDAVPIKAIASTFACDRMHMDPEVSKMEAVAFKIAMAESMVERAFREYSPVFVVKRSSIEGFLVVRLESEVANIGLMGVAPDSRREGLAKALIAYFVNWAKAKGFALCRAGTMEVNLPACRMYENAGFAKVDSLRTFHER